MSEAQSVEANGEPLLPVVLVLLATRPRGAARDISDSVSEATALLGDLFGDPDTVSFRYQRPDHQTWAYLVCCSALHTALTDESLHAIRDFLCRLGRQERLAEIGVVVGSHYYSIVDFDEATSG